MLISTKQNVDKIVQEPRNMINVFINNNVLHVYT